VAEGARYAFLELLELECNASERRRIMKQKKELGGCRKKRAA
jgi:hypothetical protein